MDGSGKRGALFLWVGEEDDVGLVPLDKAVALSESDAWGEWLGDRLGDRLGEWAGDNGAGTNVWSTGEVTTAKEGS
jgi:hypothetical protein